MSNTVAGDSGWIRQRLVPLHVSRKIIQLISPRYLVLILSLCGRGVDSESQSTEEYVVRKYLETLWLPNVSAPQYDGLE